MKDQEKQTTANEAWGFKLASPVPYIIKFSAYESIDEVRSAKDELKDDEVIKVRNAERLATARQKALAEALKAAGYEKPNSESDEQLRLREMVKTMMTSPRYKVEGGEAKARQVASELLGVQWMEETGTLAPKPVQVDAPVDAASPDAQPAESTPSEPVIENSRTRRK